MDKIKQNIINVLNKAGIESWKRPVHHEEIAGQILKELREDISKELAGKRMWKIMGEDVTLMECENCEKLREDIKEEVKKMVEEEMNHNSGDWPCEICKKRDVILKKLENL